MPERHLYQLRALTGEALCAAWGCGAAAAWRAVYIFQREHDAQATRREWLYCLVDAQGWARAHGIEPPAGGTVQEPMTLDVPEPSPATAEIQGRRPLGAGRLWGARQRARFLRG